MARGSWDRIKESARVIHDMVKGGCADEFETARKLCYFSIPNVNRMKFEEALLCAKATEALRKCMVGKEVLAKHLIAMDEGIKEDERRRLLGPDLEVKKRNARYRWWIGMRTSEEQ